MNRETIIAIGILISACIIATIGYALWYWWRHRND